MISSFNTIVVPARPEGFADVFVAQRLWPGVKLSDERLTTLKYIGVYQTRPISAITHYARIIGIQKGKKVGRFDISIDRELIEINPIPFSVQDVGAVQSPRYTDLDKMLKATCLSDVF